MVVAILLALVVAFLMLGYLAEMQERENPKRPVVVAVSAIPARAIIKSDMVRLARIPERWAYGSLLGSASQAIDRHAQGDIAAGDMLRQSDVGKGLNYDTEETALTIAVSEVTGVGGYIRPGDLVNVLVSYVNEETKLAKTIVLLQNKRVLAVGKASQPQMGSLQNIGGGGTATSDTVTLALTLEEASQLTFMSNFAQEVRLTLRQIGSEPTRVATVTSEEYE